MADKAKTGINNGIVNDFTIRPRNLTQYSAYRGVTDFTQIGQFAQFERGYSFLSVLKMPHFMVKLAQNNDKIKYLVNSFQHMLEFEFRGLEGLQDLQADYVTISDGINEQKLISKVTEDTSITVSMQYYEKQGSLITKFSEYYLTGIKDPKTQAKTYHGLIQKGILAPSPMYEVFTMLYYVTDSTMVRLEKAVLLTNCQLTSARRSELYNGTRADIGSNVEMTIEFNCYPITGYYVDKVAKTLLQDITGVKWDGTQGINVASAFSETGKDTYTYQYTTRKSTKDIATLDSADYEYGILRVGDGAHGHDGAAQGATLRRVLSGDENAE